MSASWKDIERGARDDVWLMTAVDLVRSGAATREEALVVVLLAVVKAQRNMMDAEVERLQRTVSTRFLIQPPE